jgi:UDP-glucose 4-epimerase
MRVLVTGATGTIGRPLVPALLAAGHRPVAITRDAPAASAAPVQGAQVIPGPPIEALSPADWALRLTGCDAVVHAAAIAHRGADVPDALYRRINTEATVRLAEAAAAAGIRRFVFLSSINAQVGSWSPVTVTETLPCAPADAYGRSKFAAEVLLRQILPGATILRPVLVAAPDPKGNLATLLRIAASGWPLPFGRLRAPRSLVSLANLTDAILLALTGERLPGETYVVADPEPIAVAGMLTVLREAMGLPPRLLPVPAALIGLGLRAAGRGALYDRIGRPLVVDAGLLTRAGWRPATTTDATLRAMARTALSAGIPGSPR